MRHVFELRKSRARALEGPVEDGTSFRHDANQFGNVFFENGAYFTVSNMGQIVSIDSDIEQLLGWIKKRELIVNVVRGGGDD